MVSLGNPPETVIAIDAIEPIGQSNWSPYEPYPHYASLPSARPKYRFFFHKTHIWCGVIPTHLSARIIRIALMNGNRNSGMFFTPIKSSKALSTSVLTVALATGWDRLFDIVILRARRSL